VAGDNSILNNEEEEAFLKGFILQEKSIYYLMAKFLL
jgi:hypothetical protein